MANTRWEYLENGTFALVWEGMPVLTASAKAYNTDGRQIDTKMAQLKTQAAGKDGSLSLVFYEENGLVLTEELNITSKGVPYASCTLSAVSGTVESRSLVPLIVNGDRDGRVKLWKSLWTKMLLVPYDNDMWLRYEALPMRAGRKSYDLTVLFQEESREGLLIGAMDFDVWKNALVCSAFDAKMLEARSGNADEGTHDALPHGSLTGDTVTSSRFMVLYGPDYRRLLEQYGDFLKAEREPLDWTQGTIFGFNSWAGLGMRLNTDNFRSSGRFLREELRPAGYENNGVQYVNLDGGWHAMKEEDLKSLLLELHENGQKAGTYDAPFAFFGKDIQMEILGAPGHTYEEILLKDEHGRLLPRVDGAYPMDVTHPLWKVQMLQKLKQAADWGYDYIKIDFLSHAGMEGVHYDRMVRTGRQALKLGYEYLTDYLDPKKLGRSFFISLSIAPLFPYGYGHARRYSCDAFATNEDIEYVLNAQTYSWWENNRLYAFNDPDHVALYRSFCMERAATEGEARARYTAGAIAGTLFMVSDDYADEEARKRAALIATNREVNEVAKARTSFCPVEAAGAGASHAFTARIDGVQYAALFCWSEQPEKICVSCSRAGMEPGIYRDLWSGALYPAQDGWICWQAQGCDALLLKKEGE